ncbi:MAG: hypothetical protein AAGC93_09440 [Cyanobacteria bacterium P01_F01_bin.53]
MENFIAAGFQGFWSSESECTFSNTEFIAAFNIELPLEGKLSANDFVAQLDKTLNRSDYWYDYVLIRDNELWTLGRYFKALQKLLQGLIALLQGLISKVTGKAIVIHIGIGVQNNYFIKSASDISSSTASISGDMENSDVIIGDSNNQMK